MARRLKPRPLLVLAGGLALWAMAPASGCYRHVVGARGLGAAEPMRLHEPNSQDQQTVKKRRLPSERRELRRPPP